MIGKVANDETEAQDDDVYLHNVKTYEALTESAFQITILFYYYYYKAWMMLLS